MLSSAYRAISCMLRESMTCCCMRANMRLTTLLLQLYHQSAFLVYALGECIWSPHVSKGRHTGSHSEVVIG